MSNRFEMVEGLSEDLHKETVKFDNFCNQLLALYGAIGAIMLGLISMSINNFLQHQGPKLLALFMVVGAFVILAATINGALKTQHSKNVIREDWNNIIEAHKEANSKEAALEASKHQTQLLLQNQAEELAELKRSYVEERLVGEI